MFRKNLFLIMGLILSVLSLAEERKVSILVPDDLKVENVKVVGIIKSGNTESPIHYKQQLDGDGNAVLDDDGNVIIDKSDEISLSIPERYTAYNGTEYIEMSISGVGGTDEIKYIMGYESGTEGTLTRYTIISSPDIKGDEDIHDAYLDETNPIQGLELLDFVMLSPTHNTYDDFPGKELAEKESILSGFVVGEEVMEDTNNPSNIVDIYYGAGDPEDSINVVDGGASINPTASGKNNEFELWALRTTVPDDEGNFKYLYTDDSGEDIETEDRELADKVWLYINRRKNNDGLTEDGENGPLYGDLYTANVDGTTVYSEEGGPYLNPNLSEEGDPVYNKYGYFDNFVFDVAIRFQGDKVPSIDEDGNYLDEDGEIVESVDDAEMIWPSLVINGVDVIEKGEGTKEYKWNFNGASEVGLDYIGGQFLFNVGGNSISIIPEDGQTVPPAIAQKIYVMDDDGKFLEGEATIVSKYEDTVKYRTSNIKMKVMTENGVIEENYEIMSIKE